MIEKLPKCWSRQLKDELQAPYFQDLTTFLEQERKEHSVYPSVGDVFAALRLTPFDETRVLLLGQDPEA